MAKDGVVKRRGRPRLYQTNEEKIPRKKTTEALATRAKGSGVKDLHLHVAISESRRSK